MERGSLGEISSLFATPSAFFCSLYLHVHDSQNYHNTNQGFALSLQDAGRGCQFLHSGASFLLPAPLGLEEGMTKRSHHYSFPYMTAMSQDGLLYAVRYADAFTL